MTTATGEFMTADLIYLTRADVRALLPDWISQIDVVEQTYVDMSEGSVEMPPKPGIHPRKDAFIHAMPAFLGRSNVAALKWVSGYPSNKALGIPYINGLLILNEAETGVPIAVMDCVEITAARTAAASGVCVRRWAPKGWTRAFYSNLLFTLADYSVHQILFCYGYYKYYQYQQDKKKKQQPSAELSVDEKKEIAKECVETSSHLLASRTCGLVCSAIGAGVGTLVKPGWGTLFMSTMAESSGGMLIDDGNATAMKILAIGMDNKDDKKTVSDGKKDD